MLGVPKSVLRGVDEVEELRMMRAQQQQMQQEMMMQQQQAETMKSQAEAAKQTADPEVQDAVATVMEQADEATQ